MVGFGDEFDMGEWMEYSPKRGRIERVRMGIVLADFTKRVGEQGKITIPKDIRESLNIKTGDYIRIWIIEVKKKSGGE